MRLGLIGLVAVGGALALAGCGGDDESDIAAFCDKVEEAETADLGGGEDLESQQAAAEKGVALFNEIADVAPEEIRDDIETSQGFLESFNAEVQGAESPQDLEAIATDIEAEAAEYQAAGQRLEQYADEQCGQGSEGEQ